MMQNVVGVEVGETVSEVITRRHTNTNPLPVLYILKQPLFCSVSPSNFPLPALFHPPQQ